MHLSISSTIVGVTAALLILGTLYHLLPRARQTVVFFGSSAGVAAAALGAIFTFFEIQGSTEAEADCATSATGDSIRLHEAISGNPAQSRD